MKLIDELQGFAVLTGPLWLIIILLPVCLWIAYKLAKRFKSGGTKLAGGLGIFLLVFLVPFGDEIAGRIYLNHLCATEAGVKVYQTVELPGEYWDADGKARFLKQNGDLDKTILGERFGEPHVIETYSAILKVDKRRMQLVDHNNQKILGEVIDFMYWGGWIGRNLSAHNSATDCREVYGPIFANHFYAKFFKPVNSSK
jgi:hypothetical protein